MSLKCSLVLSFLIEELGMLKVLSYYRVISALITVITSY